MVELRPKAAGAGQYGDCVLAPAESAVPESSSPGAVSLIRLELSSPSLQRYRLTGFAVVGSLFHAFRSTPVSCTMQHNPLAADGATVVDG